MRIVIKEAGVEYKAGDAPTIKTPASVDEVLSDIKHSTTEAFCVLSLNAQNKLISADIVTMGLADASMVHARETFRIAIMKNATAIIIAHNHPSGKLDPSAEDLSITRKIIEAGKVIDIKVLDHVIVSAKGFLSLREAEIVTF